ncbi:hypothetical protein JCM16303_004609 [Sporobolomyces ruberrimus]
MSIERPKPFENVPYPDPAVAFLHATYPRQMLEKPPAPFTEAMPDRPFVTLTYAQSLDAKIAGKGGKQLILSGKESMKLTHRLREMHDSILVGIGTVLNDDPQLNVRIPTLLPLASQPCPIIIDPWLLTPKDCKLVKNFEAGIGHAPFIVCNGALAADPSQASSDMRDRITSWNKTGIHVVPMLFDGHHLSLGRLLAYFNDTMCFGRSLMIEGGASVISSFLNSPEVDMIVTTVAPTFVGDGIELLRPETKVPRMEHVKTQLFGKDTVIANKPLHRKPIPVYRPYRSYPTFI